MSEKVVRIQASELKLVRILCQNEKCGAAVEAPIEDLNRYYGRYNRCPLCLTPFHKSEQNADNRLVALQVALTQLQLIGDIVKVEFVVPDKG